MQLSCGRKIVKHYSRFSFYGFIEVVTELYDLVKNIDFLVKEDIANVKPDCVILIDYLGFNLRNSEYVKTLNY